MIEVSAGIIRKNGLIFAAKRGKGRRNAHLWEFPGGKREPGEDAAQCLIRELREELSFQVQNVREAFTNEAQGIRFTFLTADALNEPVATEHEAIGFFQPWELAKLSFCPADVTAARLLCVRNVKHFLWDFDGTLMDTYGMLTDNVLRTARALGHEEDPGEMLDLLKITLPHCVHFLSEKYGITEEQFRAVYLSIEQTNDVTKVVPVDGIPLVLEELKLRGARHYIVTHRSRSSCETMLNHYGLLSYFDDMVTQQDPLPRKPDPARVKAILQHHHIQPEDAMMIGDRPIDITAGIGAGTLTLLLDMDGRFPNTDANFRVDHISKMITP